MGNPNRTRHLFIMGDDEVINVTITSDGTTAVNITGRTFVSSLAPVAGGPVTATATVAVVSAAAGTLTITFSDTQTDALAVGQYMLDLVQTNGTLETTLILAPVQVVARATA